MTSLAGGIYVINEKILEHARCGFSLMHYSNLGVQIAYNLAQINNKPSFTVNSCYCLDEFQEVSRLTGIKGIYRESIFMPKIKKK